MLNLLAAVLCGWIFPADWAHVDAVRATGFERVAGGKPHPFTIVRDRGNYVVSCSRDLDGQLAGVLRTEVGNSNGVFTWIAGNPRYVLELDHSTAPEFVESLLPARFSRLEVNGDADAIERRIGKRVHAAGEETVASRECLVLSLSGETSLVQNLWVDEDTGMSLRQVDTVGDREVYERRFTSFDLDPPVTPADFSTPEGAVVIRGEVSPQILVEAMALRSPSQYDLDLAGLRSQSAVAQGSWIKKALAPPDFSYMGSEEHENPAFDPVLYDFAHNAPGGALSPLSKFGGIPSGWTEPGQVVLAGGRVYFGFAAVPDSVVRGVYTGEGEGPNAAPGAYLGPDGSIYRLDGSQSAGPSRTTVPSDRSEAISQSEFLNRATGDTLTFVQLRNLPIKTAFPNVRLPGPTLRPDTRFGTLYAYDIAGPIPMKALEWQAPDGTSYVLVSTRLGFDALQAVAERS